MHTAILMVIEKKGALYTGKCGSHLIYSWIEIENVSLVDYLTQANKDQLLLGFCYFLCCVLTYAKLDLLDKQ